MSIELNMRKSQENIKKDIIKAVKENNGKSRFYVRNSKMYFKKLAPIFQELNQEMGLYHVTDFFCGAVAIEVSTNYNDQDLEAQRLINMG